MNRKIHQTADVSRGAELGEGVEIGPYSVIGPRVRIGDGTRVGPHVVIDGVTRIGSGNVIVGQANLGGPPQDLSYTGEATELEIGDRNTIREFVTINRGTVKGGGITRVGSDCLFMACSHVAHDCEIQDRVIMANCALLAGHILVGQGASVSGGSAGHHFITIGRLAYVGGMSRMAQDVPPFVLLEGHPGRVRGINVVGLRRSGIDEQGIDALQEAYRTIWRSEIPRQTSLQLLRERQGVHPLVLELVAALEHSSTNPKGRYRENLRSDFARAGGERLRRSVGAG
jgi:UDP-N-acetylglucosamine acyltransferase